ncbi:rhodanese-like domain-containing protein [Arthrobacter antioxidans]|uniref:rhodanese-like domain-containing protein n=1 Tax=Arthrobacter antioxidans TaxID=2895818 RepID=UPI0020000728|nr:rhodanese-like domain-containing protein [Arthrobacter antioxidans]
MAETTIAATNDRRHHEQVLDVREDSEVASGMIPGALHIPMGRLQGRLPELDRDTPVIVVCRSGNRSARVAEILNAAGFTADTMAGGMAAWTAAGLSIDQARRA